jgi:transcriptional regulator with XRE-family HTH domain
VSAFTVDVVVDRVEAEEVRSALEWAQVRAMAADGLSQREITRRLGINRRTVAKLMEAEQQPRYERAPSGSMLDPLEGVLRELLKDWPDIKAPRVTEILRDDYGYRGSVDLVRKRLAVLRPKAVRPAQRTGYRPGQVLQLDWGEMPTRPKLAGGTPPPARRTGSRRSRCRADSGRSPAADPTRSRGRARAAPARFRSARPRRRACAAEPLRDSAKSRRRTWLR